jgi:hypothetical protein
MHQLADAVFRKIKSWGCNEFKIHENPKSKLLYFKTTFSTHQIDSGYPHSLLKPPALSTPQY